MHSPRTGRHNAGRAVFVAFLIVLLAPVSNALAAESLESLPAVRVLNVRNEEQAGPGLAVILTDLTLQHLHDMKRFRVVGSKDIDQMLSQEQRKQLAGCTDTSCLVEIAGVMGTRPQTSSCQDLQAQPEVWSTSPLHNKLPPDATWNRLSVIGHGPQRGAESRWKGVSGGGVPQAYSKSRGVVWNSE